MNLLFFIYYITITTVIHFRITKYAIILRPLPNITIVIIKIINIINISIIIIVFLFIFK